MTESKWRDDSILNRLHYFLRDNGDLTTNEIIPIKKNVYKIHAINQWWIVKRYSNKADKLWSLFERIENDSFMVSFVPFPNGEKELIDSSGHYWYLMPFINGHSLSFVHEEDRIAAMNCLKDFHKYSKGLKLNIQPPRSFPEKLENRYQRFIKTKNIFVQQGLLLFFNKVDKQLKNLLEKVNMINWGKLERKARRKKIIIHGDSASHNFIRHGNDIYLIDFDLIQNAPYMYEWIQLAQRFLYDGQMNLDDLFSYEEFKRYVDDPYFHYGVMFPSDLLREWLHFLRRRPSQKELILFTKSFEEQWNSRMNMFERTEYQRKIIHVNEVKHQNKSHLERLTKWLQEEVNAAGLKGLVFEIDGSINSFVGAQLIKRAYPNNSLGVIMPCKDSQEDMKAREEVVKATGINSLIVDLSDIHRNLLDSIKKNVNEWDDTNERSSTENLKARLRLSTLYTISENYHYLVVGTQNRDDNKIKINDEIDILPLIHLSKNEVQELAIELGMEQEFPEHPLLKEVPIEQQTSTHELQTNSPIESVEVVQEEENSE